MTDPATFLEAQGFVHVENDEPSEDHWMLEGMPEGLALLVEDSSTGWSVHRDPRGDEPKGSWTDIGRDLTTEAMISLVSEEIGGVGISVDLVAGNHAARSAGEAYGLSMNQRIRDADLR